MASDQKFVDYVCDQASGARLTFKKMFGEYALYADTKVVAFICDNQLFIKPTEAGKAVLEKSGHAMTQALPYPSAKPHYLIDELLENRELLVQLIAQTAQALPLPKPKLAKPKAAPKKI
jgi:DNA transformation protein and related proteins